MEIGEAVAIAGPIVQVTPQCNPPTVDPGNWKAVIDGIKGGVGSADTLRKNMEEAKYAAPPYPALKNDLAADLFCCNQFSFPCQTHHLIPEKQLPDHMVTAWLTDSPKAGCEDPDYKLAGDTSYDTNGERNGYYMPFASTTYQWDNKPSKQNEVCFEMMRLTHIQLHQGPHSRTKNYAEDPDAEQFEPYKGQVDEFLEEIRRQVRTHVDDCDICKKNGKQKVAPLASTVAMVEQVSFLMRVLIDRGRVAVSARAGDYRNLYAPEGKGYAHPTKPFVEPSDFD